ncbi:MAG TPA: methyltransferase domain-containing protein [Candidatus Goldiibacteriota bacterium]|nr:methyltransferase domain-containing protein [Candidatus Goldiibacteriota bacterium]
MDNKSRQAKYVKMLSGCGMTLELGCGDGDFLRLCGAAGIRAEGVDKNPGALSRGLNVKKADIVAFMRKRKRNSLGNVYARHVAEHLTPKRLKMLLSASWRALRSKGRIILVFPNTDNAYVMAHEFWKDVTHVRPYPVSVIEKMLKDEGFVIILSGPDNDSWDNCFIKMLARRIRSCLMGLKWQAPDCFVVAEKK